MGATFKAASGDLLFQSDFSEPAFGLFRDPISLAQRLYSRLSKFGMRLADTRSDPGAGSFADYHIVSNLGSVGVTLRVRLERIEIYCPDVTRINWQALPEVVTGTLNMTVDELKALTNARLRTHTLVAAFHGTLVNGTARDFISKFINTAPPPLGPHLGYGIVFYYGKQAARQSAALTLDLSARVPLGLFIKFHTIWDAQQLEIAEISRSLASYVREAFTGVGIDLDSER